MATPGPQGTDYVEFAAHLWVNKQTGQVQIASVDPELNMMLAVRKIQQAKLDAAARELLRRHGKPSTKR